MSTPRSEVVDLTARAHVEGLRYSIGEVKNTLGAVQNDVHSIREDMHEAKLAFTEGIHQATLKMAPMGVWIKILSGAAIALTFGVFSLVGTLIWRAATNHIEDRPMPAQWQERLAPDRAPER